MKESFPTLQTTIEEKIRIQAFAHPDTLNHYREYPATRYFNETPESTVPEGPWDTEVLSAPTIDEQNLLLLAGYTLDNYGRPIHPWFEAMVKSSQIGVVSNKGVYWNWGPNKTADPIVFATEDAESYVLLIERNDCGMWALPGGFVDFGEDALTTAVREGAEESGAILDPSKAIKIYEGVVADPRATAHAWPETTAYAWYLPKRTTVQAASDAANVWWCPLRSLPQSLYGSHKPLIEEALHGINT